MEWSESKERTKKSEFRSLKFYPLTKCRFIFLSFRRFKGNTKSTLNLLVLFFLLAWHITGLRGKGSRQLILLHVTDMGFWMWHSAFHQSNIRTSVKKEATHAKGYQSKVKEPMKRKKNHHCFSFSWSTEVTNEMTSQTDHFQLCLCYIWLCLLPFLKLHFEKFDVRINVP